MCKYILGFESKSKAWMAANVITSCRQEMIPAARYAMKAEQNRYSLRPVTEEIDRKPSIGQWLSSFHSY